MVFTAALLYNGILSYYLVSSSDKINFTARLLHFAKHVGSGLPRIIKLQKTNRWESDCNDEITRDLGNHIDMRIKDNQKNVDPGHPGNSDLTANF